MSHTILKEMKFVCNVVEMLFGSVQVFEYSVQNIRLPIVRMELIIQYIFSVLFREGGFLM